MSEQATVNARLEEAGASAAAFLVVDLEAAEAVMRGLNLPGAAKFIRAAGDISGETMFRWASAKQLHPFGADEWGKVSPDIRLLFDGYVAAVKALAPLLDPPKGAASVHVPTPAARREEDTIFERRGRGDEGAHGRVPVGHPTSTAGVHVFHPGGERSPGAVAAMVGDHLEQFSDELMQEPLDPVEAMRAKARALPGDIGEIMGERPGPAPEVGEGAPVTVEAAEPIAGEDRTATVYVAPPKPRRGKQP
ncbi:MAG: hypothetical protein ACLP1D_28215 [Xanthobacteraceae bacterium]